MAHHHDAASVLDCELAEQPGDLAAVAGIEVGRRFVGEDDTRIVREGAGDRHPLLLAARKLVGTEVQAIGAGAVNQAVKAIVLATGYLKNDEIHVVCIPEFADVTIDDKVRTAIKLVVEPR